MTLRITGVPAVTEKPFVSDAVSLGVAAVTVRAPMVAPAAMVSVAVRDVGPTTWTLLTVIPTPKSTVVTPCAKCVAEPVTVAFKACPCWPLEGVTTDMAAAPVVTVKPPVAVAMLGPVVNVTLRNPVTVKGSIEIFAVALVGLLTVMLLTVIPVPKLAVVVPCTKFVLVPVTTTFSVWAWAPLFGAMVLRTTVPGVTLNPPAIEAVSLPDVTATLRAPSAALASMASCTVKLVADATVTFETVTRLPMLTVEPPCTKCEDCPVIVTVKV